MQDRISTDYGIKKGKTPITGEKIDEIVNHILSIKLT
jgi:hypothetical protein